MDQATLDKLGQLVGTHEYLYELSRQSICHHPDNSLIAAGEKNFCGVCNKELSLKELVNILGR